MDKVGKVERVIWSNVVGARGAGCQVHGLEQLAHLVCGCDAWRGRRGGAKNVAVVVVAVLAHFLHDAFEILQLVLEGVLEHLSIAQLLPELFAALLRRLSLFSCSCDHLQQSVLLARASRTTHYIGFLEQGSRQSFDLAVRFPLGCLCYGPSLALFL